MIEARLSGVRELIARYRRVTQFTSEELQRANKTILNEFTTQITAYPPETPGNRPPPPYWKRGIGRVVDNAGRIDQPSYKFGAVGGHTNSWTITTSKEKDGSIGWARTSVPYAPYVVGTHDQAYFHARGGRGWKTVHQIIDKMGLAGEERSGLSGKALLHFTNVAEALVRFLKGV